MSELNSDAQVTYGEIEAVSQLPDHVLVSLRPAPGSPSDLRRIEIPSDLVLGWIGDHELKPGTMLVATVIVTGEGTGRALAVDLDNAAWETFRP